MRNLIHKWQIDPKRDGGKTEKSGI